MGDRDHDTTLLLQRLDAELDQAYADVLKVNDSDDGDKTIAAAAHILNDVGEARRRAAFAGRRACAVAAAGSGRGSGSLPYVRYSRMAPSEATS